MISPNFRLFLVVGVIIFLAGGGLRRQFQIKAIFSVAIARNSKITNHANISRECLDIDSSRWGFVVGCNAHSKK